MPVYKDNEKKTYFTSFYYNDWAGNRRKKKKEGFAKQAEAKIFEREFLEKTAATPDMKFSALLELYFDDLKTRIKPTTYQNKKMVFEKKILPYFGNQRINKITSVAIRKWQNKILNKTYSPGKDKTTQKYSPTYIKNINNQLSSIFNFAVRYYGLLKNPVRVAGSIGSMRSHSIDFWTLDEFRRFAMVLKKPRSIMAFYLLFWTGCRCGELLALTFSDIDYDNKTMNINKTYAKIGKADIIQSPKTKKSIRVVTLPQFIIDMLKDYETYFYKPDKSERLFYMTKNALMKVMRLGSQLAGVKRIRVHDLRHSHASLLIEEGFQPLEVADRLGHENIQTTLQIYSHLYPNKQKELAEKLQDIGQKKA
jgi:integrase